MSKKKVILIVVVVIAAITVLSATVALRSTEAMSVRTEIRTTTSRSYFDYWEYNNKPGLFKGEDEYGGKIDVKIGDMPDYVIQHKYYRGLAPGERLVGVTVRESSRGRVSEEEFKESMYYEFNNSKTWEKFNIQEQQFAAKETGTRVIKDNTGSGFDQGRNPVVNISVAPKLLPKGVALDITDTATKPTGTSTGWRTYATFIVEWEIEIAPGPKITVQHFNKDKGTKIIGDDVYETPQDSQVIESAREFLGVEYLYSQISDDGGKTWKMESNVPTRNIKVVKDTIIRFYYGKPGGGPSGDLEVTIQHYNKDTGSKLESEDEIRTVKSGDIVSASSNTYAGLALENSVVSTNKGASWRAPIVTSSRSEKITEDTIIRFYYKAKKDLPPPDPEIDITAKLWFYSRDPKIISSSDRDRDIVVGLPKSVIDNDGEYELKVVMDPFGSKSTNGIGTFSHELLEPHVETVVKTNDDELFTTITLKASDTFQDAGVFVTDSKDKSSDDWATGRINIKTVALLQPPKVELKVNKNEFWFSESAIFSPIFHDNPGDTYPIDKKEWVIRDSKGKVKFKGDGAIQRNITLQWEEGNYTAEQIIHYKDRENKKYTDSATVGFRVKEPKPVSMINVTMINRFNNERIPLEYNSKGKIYKEIEIDIESSTKTQPELEELFPIDFNSDKTEIIVIPVTSSGVFDSSRNNGIITKNNSDRTVYDGKVNFRGKKKMTIRIDEPGGYKAMSRVYNGMLVSEWVEVDFNIRPDPPPVINSLSIEGATYNSTLSKYVGTRGESDNKTRFNLLTSYGVEYGDDDTIDQSKTLINMSYDKNNNGDFKDDGANSTMHVNSTSNSLGGILSVSKDAGLNILNFTTINKPNILGDFTFEYNIEKKETISYYEGGDMPDAPRYKVNKQIGLLIDNMSPVISVTTGKESKMEIHIFQIDTDREYVNIPDLKNNYKEKADIYLYDNKGNKKVK